MIYSAYLSLLAGKQAGALITDQMISAARKAVATVNLVGANARLAEVWLTAWRKDRPPSMARFWEALDWDFKPNCAIFQVSSDAINCSMAGSFYKIALGFDLVGRNLLDITNLAERPARLEWSQRIASGAVSMFHMPFRSEGGTDRAAQGVSLPLTSPSGDVNGYYICHSNWRPVGSDWETGSVFVDKRFPETKQLCAFTADLVASALRVA